MCSIARARAAPRFMILSIQTWATGRPAPLRTLKQFIERLKQYNDIQFARCGDIAAWCAQPDAAEQRS